MTEHLRKEDFLKPENMIYLYSIGAFPMADENGELNWYMPNIRAIIPLDTYNVPRTLRKHMEKSDYEYRYDENILRVIKLCAQRRETWISDELISAYKNLIERGHVHTVEVYQKNKLLGGLYGISYKGAFFGESMFSKVSQSSKAALIKLLERLNERGFVMLDIQFITKHLEMFGAKEISMEDYRQLLMKAYSKSVTFT